jgi:hypothetical protein
MRLIGSDRASRCMSGRCRAIGSSPKRSHFRAGTTANAIVPICSLLRCTRHPVACAAVAGRGPLETTLTPPQSGTEPSPAGKWSRASAALSSRGDGDGPRRCTAGESHTRAPSDNRGGSAAATIAAAQTANMMAGMSTYCDTMASAALRHVRDAKILAAGAAPSPDQAWHLIGFGSECSLKAGLSAEWQGKAIGHAGVSTRGCSAGC